MESWRVKVVRAFCFTPPMAKLLPFFLMAFFSAAVLLPFLTVIFVTKYPRCRIVACASSWVAASMTSLNS